MFAGAFMTGLDFTPNGTLWATSLSDDFLTSPLHTIDTATGKATTVGQITGLLADDTIDDLAYNPVDGTMYGISVVSHTLYEIDLATGGATWLGSVGGLPDVFGAAGLGASSDGTMFLLDISSNALFSFGASMMASGSVNLGFDAEFDQGIAVDWSRDDAGYAAAFQDGVSDGTSAKLLTFDTAGVIGPGVVDLGTGLDLYLPGDIAIMPVPTPGAGLLLCGGALAMALRKKR